MWEPLAYADDITLLSPTVLSIQRMLNTCAAYAEDHNLLFNEKKSTSIVFVKCKRSFIRDPELRLSATILPYMQSMVHLGTILEQDAIGTDNGAVEDRCKKFYSAVNATAVKLGDCCLSDLAWKRIMDVQLFPVLSYGSHLWNFEYGSVTRAVNKAYRKGIRRGLGMRVRLIETGWKTGLWKQQKR